MGAAAGKPSEVTLWIWDFVSILKRILSQGTRDQVWDSECALWWWRAGGKQGGRGISVVQERGDSVPEGGRASREERMRGFK